MNTPFVVIANFTGEVLRYGACPEDLVAYQAGAGETAIEAPAGVDLSSFYLSDGEWVAYPTKPGDWAQFDFAAGQWIDPRTADDLAAELEAARAAAIATINRISGEVRSRFITVIPGQEMLYMQKEQEAIAWLAADAPEIAAYPLIAAEVGITAPGPGDVAQVYVNMAHMLRLTAAQLETLRLGTVMVIEGAADVGTIETAVAQFTAALA